MFKLRYWFKLSSHHYKLKLPPVGIREGLRKGAKVWKSLPQQTKQELIKKYKRLFIKTAHSPKSTLIDRVYDATYDERGDYNFKTRLKDRVSKFGKIPKFQTNKISKILIKKSNQKFIISKIRNMTKRGGVSGSVIGGSVKKKKRKRR